MPFSFPCQRNKKRGKGVETEDKHKMKRFTQYINGSQIGFTLIELLVVIAILGVIAAIAVPNVGKFMGRGKTQSYNAELHNVQTGVIALMADSTNRTLDAAYSGVSDMDLVTADNGALQLSLYITGLNADGTVKTNCTYTISQDGGVILQSTP
jgi:prepilin-type N-terminal cleavage/methylation domain-containing protein